MRVISNHQQKEVHRYCNAKLLSPIYLLLQIIQNLELKGTFAITFFVKLSSTNYSKLIIKSKLHFKHVEKCVELIS